MALNLEWKIVGCVGVRLNTLSQVGGFYQVKDQFYVNRGFGFLGYPGRVGILPEVTELILRKKV